MTTRMTPASARVVDPVLTNSARGYQMPTPLVWPSLYPAVNVNVRGGRRIEFDRSEFVARKTLRAPGSDAAEVEFGHTGAAFALDPHSLDGKLPIEVQQDADSIPGMNMQMRTAQKTREILELEYEREVAAEATDNSNYGSNTAALSGTARWDTSTGTPSADVQAAVAAIRAATGKRPNTIVIGGNVYDQMRNNGDIVDRIKYTQRGIPNLDDLRAYFGLPNVVLGDAVTAATAAATTFSDVWGNNVIVAYVAQGSVSRAEPSFAYTYQMPLLARVPYWRDKARSWMFPVDWERTNELVGAEAGYLITSVVT